MVKELYKKQNGVEFSRKPYSMGTMSMKKVMMDMNKELAIEARAYRQGITQDQAKKKDKIMGYIKMIPLMIFFYFLVKNQIWPLVKPYIPD